MIPFDPTVVGAIAAVKQRGQMLEELRRLEGKQGATVDNKAEIKELKRLLDGQQKQLAQQKKEWEEQKGNQNLLFEVSTELKDLDERLKDDEQFEVAAKEFIALYERTNFDWILDHKNYDSLDFKEFANKTSKLCRKIVQKPNLMPQIEEADRRIRIEAEKKEADKKAQKEAEKKSADEAIKKKKARRRQAKAREEREEREWNERQDASIREEDRKSARFWIAFIVIYLSSSLYAGFYCDWEPIWSLAPALGWIPCWFVASLFAEEWQRKEGQRREEREEEWQRFEPDEIHHALGMQQPKMDEAGEVKRSAEETSYFSTIFMFILLFVVACIIYGLFM